jgi:hypothetical protein
MISLIASQTDNEAANLTLAALGRSLSQFQVRRLAAAALPSVNDPCVVAINPSEEVGQQILDWVGKGRRKAILFGRLPPCLIGYLQMEACDWPVLLEERSRCAPAPTSGFTESPCVIRYCDEAARLGAVGWRRPLERFDFTDEWNNLGYGAVRVDGSHWSLSLPLRASPADELASLDLDGEPALSYAACHDRAEASVLWFNRSVGPIDSFEWRLIENFLAHYRHDELACQPVLSEIPWGYDAAVTMRLDCDEDIESARSLWQCYQGMDVPFSLAVHTTNLSDERHHSILREVRASGGAIVSHTATHAPNWGGSYEAAFHEGLMSKRLLEAILGHPVVVAVSPFHQTPDYALAALADAGYLACIGGIIRNDPAFLLARSGHLAGMAEHFIGHSQQCMLHGDCMLQPGGDRLSVYKQAFDIAKQTRTFFGFLDHPFSARYQYGWSSELDRIHAHQDFISHIRSQSDRPLFLNIDQAMSFLRFRAQARVALHEGRVGYFSAAEEGPEAALTLAVEYNGELRQAERIKSLQL